MKREKIVLTPSLKAENFDVDSVVIATGSIKEVASVKTKFDDDDTTSTVIKIEDQAEPDKDKAIKGVFANSTSINNLIDAFGQEDNIWLGKMVKVVCNRKNYLNKKQLVIEAIR